MSKILLRDQTGTVMVVELALLALLIAVAGFAFLKVRAVRNTSGGAAVTTAKQTIANGTVRNAVKALDEDANAETQAADKEENEADNSTDITSKANDLGGSYNENSF